MKKLNDLLARIPKMQARAKQRAEREPLPGEPLQKNVVQLPAHVVRAETMGEQLG